MKLDLEIDLLRAFVTIAETCNFTVAARQLNRVQSAISMKIKRLEEIVGCQLFERDKTVQLTQHGKILLGHAHRILEINDEALLAVRSAPMRGTFKVGTSETHAACLIPRVLSGFSRAFPEVVVDIHCGHGWILLEQMDSAELDLVLVTRQPNRKDGQLVRQERLVWIHGQGSDVYKESSLPLAVFPEGCYYRASAIRALEAQNRPWHIAFTSPNHSGVMASVLAGRAVTVMTESVLDNGIRALDIRDGFPALPTVDIVLYQSNGGMSPMARRLAREIKVNLAQDLYQFVI